MTDSTSISYAAAIHSDPGLGEERAQLPPRRLRALKAAIIVNSLSPLARLGVTSLAAASRRFCRATTTIVDDRHEEVSTE